MGVEQETLHLGEQRRIQKAIAGKVYELESNPAVHPELFKKLYREIKSRFEVSTYKEVKREDLQEVIRYIEGWAPRKVS
ncbi:ORF6C domain-containing protein [Planococcus halotolerans]|uniref:ORF6C domain-containing protein n=1 Tax=Planococcus halotolerans TaxID=2233542 RepID=A0A365KKN1_9BACL|nr:ORF6C domain-containing protein [Planococcus halotolerans]RAZ73601.1 hypothetical protein DP120_16825 [Planococcus halotolerans]